MKIKLALSVVVSLMCACATSSAQSSWAFLHSGKALDAEKFLYEPRVVEEIAADLGVSADSSVMLSFHGVPAPVSVTQNRFVTSSSCEAHSCPYNMGFFWIDTETGDSLSANVGVSYPEANDHQEVVLLLLGGSAATYESLPVPAVAALQQWLLSKSVNPGKVLYRSKSMAPGVTGTPLDPSVLHLEVSK